MSNRTFEVENDSVCAPTIENLSVSIDSEKASENPNFLSSKEKTASMLTNEGNVVDTYESGVTQSKPRRNKVVSFITKTAMFSAISVVLMLLNFPIFPAFGFLKMDFSAVAALLAGFIVNPLSAVVVEVIKIICDCMEGSMTGYIGELSNLICSLAFVVPATIIYHSKKTLPFAIIGLCAGVVSTVIISALSNYFFVFPIFIKLMGVNFLKGGTVLSVVLSIVIPFNLIKSVSCAAITFILYKQVKNILKRI